MKIIIIGIPDKDIGFNKEQLEQINATIHFAGGKRHYELVKKYLPKNHQWTAITIPLSKLYDAIRNCPDTFVVFASGDPLFFGIGITLQREFPDTEIKIYPYFNSLQMLAHKVGVPYGEFPTISLTGRPWHKFDQALIQGVERMGILTDRKNTPKTIVERMLRYNYSNYKMYYGEHMGGEQERVKTLTLQEALKLDFKHPNCFFLEKADDKIPRKGISELDFKPLDGRPKMITKMAVRLATIALMRLDNRSVFWDVGSCTGSVAIETKLHYPHLKITAFEKRLESKELIPYNCEKFQTPGIALYINDYTLVDKTDFEQPDAVFLGGYGGKMEEVLSDIDKYLQNNGVLAFNSVTEKSKSRFVAWCENNNYLLEHQQVITVDSHNPITILVAKKY
ncbi:MAG: cobalamin biosynthesis bifunctional protein CbiET [Draconibacterium sp.]|nr:MAG: cobalamin biosynthesis bifunctional protein CbiET [Draconibacterium sp.]